MDHDDNDTEEDSGKPVLKRSRYDEEGNGDESSDDDMHDNDIEYIFFGSSADDESDTDEYEWPP